MDNARYAHYLQNMMPKPNPFVEFHTLMTQHLYENAEVSPVPHSDELMNSPDDGQKPHQSGMKGGSKRTSKKYLGLKKANPYLPRASSTKMSQIIQLPEATVKACLENRRMGMKFDASVNYKSILQTPTSSQSDASSLTTSTVRNTPSYSFNGGYNLASEKMEQMNRWNTIIYNYPCGGGNSTGTSLTDINGNNQVDLADLTHQLARL